MLAKHLDNGEVNQLPVVLEEPALASVLKVFWGFVVVFCLFVSLSNNLYDMPNTHLFHTAYVRLLRALAAC